MADLLERLRRGEIVVADGGLGTQLMERGLEPGECPEAFNLERPEEVAAIASRYLEAGAQIVTTNTFGGSPLKLKAYALDDRAEEINRRAVELLLDVVDRRGWVAGSVGPSGAILKPYGDTDEEEVLESFERQIEALATAGADLICIETMTDLREATLAIRAAASKAPELPVAATMTFDPTPRGFFTIMGVGIEQAATKLAEAGADIVGSNCGNGIEKMVEIAGQLGRHSSLPIIIQSNAGLPENRAGKVVYPETPEFMARKAQELIELGVAIIGGCCGTTPEHIRAIATRVGSSHSDS